MPCVCGQCKSFEAAALDSYHFVVMKLQATPPLKEPKVTKHPCIAWDITYIDEHLDERLALNEPAAKGGLSMWSFCAVFGHYAGVSPRCYIWGQRGETPACCRNTTQKLHMLGPDRKSVV